MKNNENFEICSKCNGSCCKLIPGILEAHQLINVNEESIREKLKQGYQFDYWEGDIPIYYLRPATTKSIGKLVDPSWGGTCIYFEDGKGCKLSFKERPQQCQDLEPKLDVNCIPFKRKKDYIDTWLPYQELIKKIIDD